ncbi:MAG: methyltransferase domain-containing protein [Deltaproteobacteria bacterium]|nr:methyltransferase domain-containing protein [Deltaproteobacteria bacterium]
MTQEIGAYNEALSSGQYEKPGGLIGKYDNVRRFWEDEQLGLYLRPYLEQLVARKQNRQEKLRIMDIGCGSGDGFEFITGIDKSQPPISQHNSRLIPPSIVELYTGVDINEGLVRQAQDAYGNRENMKFIVSDFNNYPFTEGPTYDVYLANYGTFSHNTDEQTIEILNKLARHSDNGTIIAIDWLGRYSYEWQTLWTRDLKNNQWMDYAISYIYADSERETQDLTTFPLRIIGRAEVQHVYHQVKKLASGAFTLRKLADHSSFVGRHMDTAQYNPHAQPLRGLVNSLFEPNVSTDLDELLVNYVPMEGFDEVNTYHRELTRWWNYFIACTKTLLEKRAAPETPARIPGVVTRALSTMKKLIRSADGIKLGNPRSSLIEPQLGYCLRELEIGLQKGLGCGHGLVAIFEIRK